MIRPFGGWAPDIAPSAFLAPTATVLGRVTVGEEASIWFGAVLRGDHPDYEIRVGARANVQDNVVVHVSAHGPTVIEEAVTVGHGAVLESCRIGARSVIGMNAVVLQGAELGEGCLVAAGAVVKGDARIPAGSLVAGVPGRVRPLTAVARTWVEGSADHYVELSRAYLEAWTDGD